MMTSRLLTEQQVQVVLYQTPIVAATLLAAICRGSAQAAVTSKPVPASKYSA